MRAIEAKPEAPIRHASELEQVLERSIHWLKHDLQQIFNDLSA